MNASDLKTIADEVNAAKRRASELPFEVMIAKAEYAASKGDYIAYVSDYDIEHGRRDWLSKENYQKFLERGFWFETSFGHLLLRWDEKRTMKSFWERFW